MAMNDDPWRLGFAHAVGARGASWRVDVYFVSVEKLYHNNSSFLD